jgi:2,3-bisphosphoglycerate-independent phosphoglycerate mutase
MFTEDLDTFLDPDEIGDTATAGAASINGIFAKEFAEVNSVEGFYPTFTCKTADVVAVAKGTTITIGGDGYKVLSKRQDGTGITQIILEAS